ncbi:MULTISPECIES: aldehyde dehydrogenase family protein [unclassified Micromonospora]|uniref:aldehyde dehydrogenase family protein n=1 Tax=unclassified Micromonospora TaxID=2617518 RepID=UPI0003EEACB4|nr:MULTISPECIES: aldehyde dehydrogenase family protein [unclassified Micromonospora]EWM65832.1 aldehyde dehydrogenase [Micromonospora sp. M42]MCK1806219.1 aldehyde dehydrogenase family protein [Micromonospora sp. R42106]MCK1830341.1 aldehyde dehydrogenase family protein [Micromonospora sp. R42003]MCK1843301.1 aldehyde dehydrogenase family protein [Micromonospora sp. R42004]MCM1015721.1 aldehyde dehydrogenase family protein [Micromonospora sp. XM-20-01]
MEPRAFYVAGRPAHGEDELTVTHPYDGQPVGRTTLATADQVEAAVAGAARVAAEAAALPAHARAAALDHVSRRLAGRADEVAALITAENGKPVKWAKAEVGRAVSTFRWAAEEARRFSGDLQRLDTDPAATGRIALVRRVPRGPVLGITPFNFPLNLVAHKVAPALAVGTPIVVKPAPATPLTALLLGEILAETDLPEGMFSVLPLPNERAAELVADPRLPVVSFTGSGPVGAAIRRAAPDKHVTLELGGNAAAVICADWSADDDLTFAAQRIATFSNYQAGQSCIAVQRVYVHERLYDGFLPRLVAAVQALRTGDPRAELTDVGPLVSVEAAQRVETWVDEAVAAGAVVEAGGRRDGATYPPTVLSGVSADAKVCAEEVFGPVLVVAPVADDRAAFAAVNDSAYGLQAGVFTHRLDVAFDAARTLEVGGVIVGDVPSYRADQMPYGGMKGSGVGREGLRSAMDDYTEPRVMVLTGVPL